MKHEKSGIIRKPEHVDAPHEVQPIGQHELFVDGLARFTRIASQCEDADMVLRHLVDTLVSYAGADAVAVFLLSGERLELKAQRRLPPRIETWSVARTEAEGELGRALLEELRGQRFVEARTLPLSHGARLFGAVVILSRREPSNHEPRRALARMLADLASGALAQIFDRRALESASRDLEAARTALGRTELICSLGRMSAGVMHDVANLLHPLSIELVVSMRARERGDDAELGASQLRMKQILARAKEQLARMRIYGKHQAPAPGQSRVDLNAVAHEAVELSRPHLTSRKGEKACIHEELRATAMVQGHPTELICAVMNLLTNALDANLSASNVRVSTGSDDGHAWISVRDDGAGMTAAVRERAFEPFFTTKGALGTGLGLPQVMATVRRHGGDVALGTELGKGTTVTMSFPVTPAQKPLGTRNDISSEPSGSPA